MLANGQRAASSTRKETEQNKLRTKWGVQDRVVGLKRASILETLASACRTRRSV